MGRMQAKQTLDVEEYQKQMQGVWSSCVNFSTIDESPMAYKPHEEIEKYLGETVEILHRVVPVYNFKAADGPCSLDPLPKK